MSALMLTLILILISIRNPQIMSLNLSIANFSVVNSNMNGLYFSSTGDVHFEAKAIGCNLLATLPFGTVSMDFWASTAPKLSLQLSDVTMKGVPSKQGALRTG